MGLYTYLWLLNPFRSFMNGHTSQKFLEVGNGSHSPEALTHLHESGAEENPRASISRFIEVLKRFNLVISHLYLPDALTHYIRKEQDDRDCNSIKEEPHLR